MRDGYRIAPFFSDPLRISGEVYETDLAFLTGYAVLYVSWISGLLGMEHSLRECGCRESPKVATPIFSLANLPFQPDPDNQYGHRTWEFPGVRTYLKGSTLCAFHLDFSCCHPLLVLTLLLPSSTWTFVLQSLSIISNNWHKCLFTS